MDYSFFAPLSPQQGTWGFKACEQCLLPVTRAALAVKPPEYKTVLELDKKIRAMGASPVRKTTPVEGKDGSMKSYAHSNYLDQSKLSCPSPSSNKLTILQYYSSFTVHFLPRPWVTTLPLPHTAHTMSPSLLPIKLHVSYCRPRTRNLSRSRCCVQEYGGCGASLSPLLFVGPPLLPKSC